MDTRGRIHETSAPYNVWIIPAIAAFLYVKGIIFIAGWNWLRHKIPALRVDYFSHYFHGNPFESINNLDGLTVNGCLLIFLGGELALFLYFADHININKPFRILISNGFTYLAAGGHLFYGLLFICHLSLAYHEGYYPLSEFDLGMNHGPFHRISHLGILIVGEALALVCALCLSAAAFLIKLSWRSFWTLIIGVQLFLFHVYTQLWLVD